MIGEQSFEGRRENLNQANKLSRTYATLLEALNRHRGKGQQKVTVEHVHVHQGGQAIVGTSRAGGRVPAEIKDQPHALAHAPGATMPSADRPREPVPVACDEERSMPDARGMSPGAPMGRNNALKHGHYTAQAMANRREIATLLRTMKVLAKMAK
jgi:hypothetical protein